MQTWVHTRIFIADSEAIISVENLVLYCVVNLLTNVKFLKPIKYHRHTISR